MVGVDLLGLEEGSALSCFTSLFQCTGEADWPAPRKQTFLAKSFSLAWLLVVAGREPSGDSSLPWRRLTLFICNMLDMRQKTHLHLSNIFDCLQYAYTEKGNPGRSHHTQWRTEGSHTEGDVCSLKPSNSRLIILECIKQWAVLILPFQIFQPPVFGWNTTRKDLVRDPPTCLTIIMSHHHMWQDLSSLPLCFWIL